MIIHKNTPPLKSYGGVNLFYALTSKSTLRNRNAVKAF